MVTNLWHGHFAPWRNHHHHHCHHHPTPRHPTHPTPGPQDESALGELPGLDRSVSKELDLKGAGPTPGVGPGCWARFADWRKNSEMRMRLKVAHPPSRPPTPSGHAPTQFPAPFSFVVL